MGIEFGLRHSAFEHIIVVQVTMTYSFLVRTNAATICIILMLAMFLLFWLGLKLRKRWRVHDLEPKGGILTVQSALLALFGFILALTFNMSGNRYDYLRNVYIDESNAIGTAVLRSGLYSDSVRTVFRSHFKEYLEGRITMYENPRDTTLVTEGKERSSKATDSLWQLAMQQSKLPNMLIPTNNMVPALNEMFDVGASRDILARTNIPDLIIYMLLTLALLISMTEGITHTGQLTIRDTVVVCCFIVFTTLVIYITLDLGRPLRGLIRPSAAEESITGLRKLFAP